MSFHCQSLWTPPPIGHAVRCELSLWHEGKHEYGLFSWPYLAHEMVEKLQARIADLQRELQAAMSTATAAQAAIEQGLDELPSPFSAMPLPVGIERLRRELEAERERAEELEIEVKQRETDCARLQFDRDESIKAAVQLQAELAAEREARQRAEEERDEAVGLLDEAKRRMTRLVNALYGVGVRSSREEEAEALIARIDASGKKK